MQHKPYAQGQIRAVCHPSLVFDVLPTNTISFQTATHLIIYEIRDNKQLITTHAHIRGVVPTTT